jgi:hypothetical protein
LQDGSGSKDSSPFSTSIFGTSNCKYNEFKVSKSFSNTASIGRLVTYSSILKPISLRLGQLSGIVFMKPSVT